MRTMKKISLTIIALIVLGGGAWFVWRHENAAKTASSTQSKTNGITATISGFNKKQYSLTDPTSIWIIVNKQHPLNPKDYAPSDLVVPNVPLRVPGNESMEVRHVTPPPQLQRTPNRLGRRPGTRQPNLRSRAMFRRYGRRKMAGRERLQVRLHHPL